MVRGEMTAGSTPILRRVDALAGPEDICAVTDPRWPDLVSGSKSELFVDQRWFQVLRDTYGIDVRARICGEASVLPYARIDDPRGRRTVALPFCDFVDAPMSPEHWEGLVAPLLDDQGSPLTLETVADHPAQADSRLASAVDGVHLVVPLSAPTEELFGGFASMTRRQIRKSTRRGIRFVASQDRDHLESFHRLHVGVRKHRHHLLAQPLGLFENIARAFQNDWTIIVGLVNDEVVGGCLLMRTASAWHYKFSVSHPDFRSEGVSHGAVFAALQHCEQTDTPFFDFGRSDLAHDGLVQFKRRFAATERELHVHRSGPLVPTQFGTDLGRLTELLTRPGVPDSVTAEAGSLLYRYFA